MWTRLESRTFNKLVIKAATRKKGTWRAAEMLGRAGRTERIGLCFRVCCSNEAELLEFNTRFGAFVTCASARSSRETAPAVGAGAKSFGHVVPNGIGRNR